MLSTLETPSSDVQQAVSECLAPLVFQFKSKVEDYINDLMSKLLNPALPTSIRKGAAWGIAGLVKGYGISALSEFDIVRNLIEAAEDKKEAKRRESVAYAFEYLSISLKRFFEPYVIEVLPTILKNLGDSVPEVRNATAEATKAIMAHTTSYGVMKLIPVAVSNLDDISWRTKRGSVELLGNMAYLDPTQLSTSLSTIVPEIVGVLNDSHKEVRKAADESLKRFGEVIRNPEIQKLVPVLIQAIGDPTKYTEDALDALIQTQFVHYIDGPSLALIIHVIPVSYTHLDVYKRQTYGIETVLDNQETTKKTHFRRNQHRKRIRESVLQATSKTFTHCFKHNGNASSYFSAICKIVLEDHTKLKLPVTGVVVIMGALTQSSIQLAPSQPALLHELKEKYAEKYIEFIGKEIIIGKNPPSTFCLEISLNPFLKEFLTEESFKSQLLPNLEKANLRSPESAFAIAAELYAGVNAKNINLLNIFTSSKLMTQSFSSFKSSKEAVRDISLHSVITLFESIDIENVDESDLLKYVDEIFKNIKSNLNADYKSLVSKILFAIPSSFEQVSAKIAQDLSIYVTKEGNENALNIMLLAFFSHYLTLSQPSADINKLIKNGFKEKKPSLKKCWFTSLLEMSAKSTKEMLESFEAECLEFISETLSHHFKHDHKNILACLIYFDAAYTLGITDLQEKLHTVISSLPKTSIIGAAFVNVALSRTLVSSDRLEGVKLLYTAFAREPELIGLSVVEALELSLIHI